MIRQFRSEAQLVTKGSDPGRPSWKDTGTAAALAWLQKLYDTKGYPALVAALEDAIRSGMAEGEADALALAADRQGVAGFVIGAAFTIAYDRLAGNATATRQAQDAASGMVDGAAGDVGSALADRAGGDGSEQDMTDAAGEAAAGDQSRAVEAGTDWWLWKALGIGALGLYAQAAAADSALSLDWVTAGDARVCQACQDNADSGPYTLATFPALPAHGRCRCSPDATGKGLMVILSAAMS